MERYCCSTGSYIEILFVDAKTVIHFIFPERL